MPGLFDYNSPMITLTKHTLWVAGYNIAKRSHNPIDNITSDPIKRTSLKIDYVVKLLNK
jgi:hypothetical protein